MKIFNVEGMTCEHCANAVREELTDAGLEVGTVDVAAGTVEASGDDAAVAAAIAEAGYKVV